MTARCFLLLTWVCLLTAGLLPAQPVAQPPGSPEPLFRLQTDGPTADVTALAFSPDGKTLYAAGFDKLVRVWRLNAAARFELEGTAYRVPIGPGMYGMLNALDVAPDGQWLVTAGTMLTRSAAGFREAGIILPRQALKAEGEENEGLIYAFDTRTREVRLLRGHRGPVVDLAFAPSEAGKPALLVSLAREPGGVAGQQWQGVLRLWDVAKAESLALREGLPDPAGQVGKRLSVRHTGKGAKQIQALLAGGDDGTLRVWDVEKSPNLWQGEHGKYNYNAIYLADQGGVLTTGVSGAEGQLQFWQAPGAAPQRDAARAASLPAATGFIYLPLTLNLLSSRADGKLDYAAILGQHIQLPNKKRGDHLFLVSLSPDNFRAVGVPLPPRQGRRDRPPVASAPRGEYLALADNATQAIYVYSVKQLLNGKVEPPHQVLRSSGTVFQRVAFFKKGEERALALTEQPPAGLGGQPAPKPREVLFEFHQRRLGLDRTGWEKWAPSGGWTTTVHEGEKPTRITVYRGQEKAGEVSLQTGQQFVEHALLPPKHFSVPLLAVSVDEGGVPHLFLYNVLTGEVVRQLSSHIGRIHALAFSGDGKLLASAARDQTVSVWALDDLDKTLGQRAMIPGLAVHDEKGEVVVVSLLESERGPKNTGKLDKGDVIERFAGQKKPFASGKALREAVAALKPGTKVSLQVRNQAGERRTVELVLGQFFDERKPLLSFFATRGDRLEDRHWLGWSPLGFYDASGRDAERHFGWHFNTGKADAPTAFAAVADYRKQLYREGLLKNLITRRELGAALQAWDDERPPPAPPVLGLRVLDREQKSLKPDERGQILVQQPAVTLRLDVNGFPLDRIAKLEWRLNDGAWRAFDRTVGREWLTDLEALPWKRGEHRVAVVLHTHGREPQTYTQELSLRYQPRPPRLESALPPRSDVKTRDHTVRALVHPGLPGQAFAVRLVHQRKGQAPVDRKLAEGRTQPWQLEEKVDLEAGDNVFELIATNQDAPPGAEGETSRLSWTVHYGKVDRPRLVLQRILSEAADGGESVAHDLVHGRPLVVDVPRVRLRGEITADDDLIKAEWRRDKEKPAPLTGFVPATTKRKLAVDQLLELQPGPQTVRLQAQTRTSPLAEAEVVLDYRPLLPEVTLTPPEELVYHEGEDKPQREIVLSGAWKAPRFVHPFSLFVQVNDRDFRVSRDDATQTWTAQVPLQFGVNRIRVQLRNDWQRSATTRAVLVRYLRPPHITDWEGPRQTKEPFVTLTGRVISSVPLLKEVRAEVGGRPIDPAQVEIAAPAVGGKPWEVRLKNVDLKEGANTITLHVRNTDAECRQLGVVAVTYRPVRPPPLPEVGLRSPAQDTPVTEPELEVRAWLRSTSPLRRVTLLREGTNAARWPITLAALQPGALEGLFELTTRIQLLPGVNRLRLEAVNDGGEASATVTINYQYRPVRLHLDQLTLRKPGDAPVPLLPEKWLGPERVPIFPPTPEGHVVLEGRVRWDRGAPGQLSGDFRVQVYVNGFKHYGDLEQAGPADPQTRRFKVPLVLSKERGNQIEIELPDLPRDADVRGAFTLDCKKPVLGQRLHVLIINPGGKDPHKLETEVMRALASSAFVGSPKVHACLTDPIITRQEIFPRLWDLREQVEQHKRIDMRSAAGMNDVILVYFVGCEAITPREHYFHLARRDLTAKPRGKPPQISIDELLEYAGLAPGAPMLLLDAERTSEDGQDKLACMDGGARVSALRYAGKPGIERPSLLTVWAEGRQQGITLREVSDYLMKRAEAIQQLTPCTCTPHLSPRMQDLRVGGGP